jgi:hypothetical protein
MDVSEMADAGAEIEVEALAEGAIEDKIELLEIKAVAEAEGEGEGSAGGEVVGGDESGGNSVPELSDISFKLSFAVLATIKEWTGPCDWFDGRNAWLPLATLGMMVFISL